MKIIYENSDSEKVVETQFTENELKEMLSYAYFSKSMKVDREDFCFCYRMKKEDDTETKAPKKKRKT